MVAIDGVQGKEGNGIKSRRFDNVFNIQFIEFPERNIVKIAGCALSLREIFDSRTVQYCY